jgi:uncharacterized protein YrzB (UPF0473 family)
MEPKTIVITDEKGNDQTFHVLFTHTTKGNISYVFYVNPQDEESVFCSRYDEEGKLFDLVEEELVLVQELLKRYEDEEEDLEDGEEDEDESSEKSGI